ncbi:hypothetical protein Mycch_5071 [Mycolicibacterium chubuense NBB4]|uniref:EfeO-type cupredoxin-like domain-containing protein n=1 Tax=Mycolicibacterium chubuense (strain NBB4) TaxID=710421 RepID=I4BR51_MYCCN|nr:hypothetical protein [Mycolicibacterium chubuense]AFM19758.1 hypothetical protein Mycch_5071 [Mycolicibacterium chubuense NBB4]
MNATQRILALSVAATSAAFLLAGCGGSKNDDASPSGPAAGTPSALPDNQAPPRQLVVNVAIKGGSVTPTNEQLEASVNEPIVLRVDSDTADQLHVHSTPEHEFPVAAARGQSFQFTIDTPGRVDVELHNLNKTVATIQVQ